MEKKSKINVVLIFIILLFIILLITCNNQCSNERVRVTMKTEVRTDTLHIKDTVHYPAPYKVFQLRLDTIYIDTGKVIRDYFTEKYYAINYEDTILKAYADIKVLKNNIELAAFQYELYRKTITHTITEERIRTPTFGISLGAGMTYSIPNSKFGLDVLGTVRIKRNMISLRYDIFNGSAGVGYQYQITK